MPHSYIISNPPQRNRLRIPRGRQITQTRLPLPRPPRKRERCGQEGTSGQVTQIKPQLSEKLNWELFVTCYLLFVFIHFTFFIYYLMRYDFEHHFSKTNPTLAG